MNKPKVINIEAVLAGQPPRTNINIIHLDERYNVRVARVTGRFPWHMHPGGDEGWLIWKGGLRIEIEGQDAVELGPGDCTTIRKGVCHSPVCLEEDTVVVVFNVRDFENEFVEQKPDLGDFAEHDA